LSQVLARVTKQQSIDPHRVVVYGQGSGGPLAWLLGFSHRDVFRAISVAATPLPRRLSAPPNEPGQRLAILATVAGDSNASAAIAQGLQKCADAGYPVSVATRGSESGQLREAELEELARWIDTLDRF
jgi:poly(3-hydroxybutyrate) depolymerase